MRFTTSITVGAQRAHLSIPRESRAWRLANCVYATVGPAPSRAWLVMTRENVTALSTSSSLTITWTQTAVPASNTRTLNFSGFYLVGAERLLQGGEDDGNALYLAEFADGRYMAEKRKLDSAAIIANFRSYAQDSEYLTGTSGYTWASLLTALWNACGTLGAYPGLPAGLPIDGVPENAYFVGQTAYRSLCAVLDQLDCGIAHNPLAGTFSIVQLGEAQTIAAHADSLQWNGQPIDLTAIQAAANVRVYFHYHRKSYGQERDTSLANNWAYDGAGDVSVQATGIAGASGTKPLWDDLAWQLDEDNAAANAGAISTRAANRASRYATRWTVAPQHKIFSGLLSDILPGGKVRAVLWRNWDDGEAQVGGTVTEYICRSECVTGLRPTASGEAWFDAELVAPEREGFAPPDLGRHSYPNYPRLPNIVQVNSASGSPGDTVTPNADGFHKGRVRRWVANAMATLEDCWIRFVDSHDAVDGQVTAIQHEFYGPARLSGMSTSDGSRLPVYLVRKGTSGSNTTSDLTKFRLTANLNTGGSAAAVKRVWGGAAYADGDVILVHDWYGIALRGMFQGVTNFEGIGLLRDGTTDEYNIVWMEQYAFGVEFTLTSDFTAGVATATVTASWHQGLEPGATISVHDDQGRFTDAIEGCKGVAWRSEYADAANPTVPYYKVISCQRAAERASVVLTYPMCADDPQFDAGTWAIEPHGDETFDPGAPAFGNIINTEPAHRAKAGDVIWVNRIDKVPPFTWRVYDVEHKSQRVLFGLRITSAAIQTLSTICAVEYCEDPVWEDEIGLSAVAFNSVDGADCDITKAPVVVLAFGGSVGAPVNILNLESVELVSDVTIDADSLNKCTRTVFVCSPGSESCVDITDIEDCP